MREQIKVRLYATCEIQVPLDTEIDLYEFAEWYEESGAVFAPEDIDTDAIVEFINASPDTEYDTGAQFPKADPSEHEILRFTIDEAELLPIGLEAGNE